MKYLLIGIWHGRQPDIQTRKTDIEMTPKQAAEELREHCGRATVPDHILIVANKRWPGPYVRYEWRKGLQYRQKRDGTVEEE